MVLLSATRTAGAQDQVGRSRAGVWARARAPRIHAPAAGRPPCGPRCRAAPRPRPATMAVPRSGRTGSQARSCERLGSGDGVDHACAARASSATDFACAHFSPMRWSAGRRPRRTAPPANAPRRRTPRAVRPGRRVAAQRGFLEGAQGLFTELGRPLRHGRSGGPGGLILFLHERGSRPGAGTCGDRRVCESTDLTSVGPALTVASPTPEQRLDLPCPIERPCSCNPEAF